MVNYLLNNKEWIFSGIGVFILTILLSIWKKRRDRSKGSITNRQSIKNSTFQKSVVNNITAERVELHQTAHNKEIEDRTVDQKDNASMKVDGYPDLEKAKAQYLYTKKRRRAAIYQAIIKITKEYPDQPLELRYVLDDTEDQTDERTADVVQELQEMSEEGILRFLFNKDDTTISPYSVIELTKRFYSTIQSERK